MQLLHCTVVFSTLIIIPIILVTTPPVSHLIVVATIIGTFDLLAIVDIYNLYYL